MSTGDYPRAALASSNETPSGSPTPHALVLLPDTLGYRDSACQHIFPPEKSLQSQASHRKTNREIPVSILRKTPQGRRCTLSILRRKRVSKMWKMQRGYLQRAHNLQKMRGGVITSHSLEGGNLPCILK